MPFEVTYMLIFSSKYNVFKTSSLHIRVYCVSKIFSIQVMKRHVDGDLKVTISGGGESASSAELSYYCTVCKLCIYSAAVSSYRKRNTSLQVLSLWFIYSHPTLNLNPHLPV